MGSASTFVAANFRPAEPTKKKEKKKRKKDHKFFFQYFSNLNLCYSPVNQKEDNIEPHTMLANRCRRLLPLHCFRARSSLLIPRTELLFAANGFQQRQWSSKQERPRRDPTTSEDTHSPPVAESKQSKPSGPRKPKFTKPNRSNSSPSRNSRTPRAPVHRQFHPKDLLSDPYARQFVKACDTLFRKIYSDPAQSADSFNLEQFLNTPAGLKERHDMLPQFTEALFKSISFIVVKFGDDLVELVKHVERPDKHEHSEVLEDFKTHFFETDPVYSEYDNNLGRFKQYVENPPLVPSLGKIYAVLENIQFEKGGKNEIIEDVVRLVCASFLRFYRARLRISSFRDSPKINMTNPAEWYPQARALTRRVILHIGPTNSGKTYNALKAFEDAKSGYYAGPLRLLAREVYNRMKSKNKKCNLVTGEEVIQDYDEQGLPVKLSSGTVEMVDITHPMDVAVIDEIQMIEDNSRGWAWTQAFLGLQAKEIHLCGDPSSERVVTELVRMAGDTLEVRRYERLSPLTVEKRALLGEAKRLQPGDCVIAFSKNDILDWKAEIEKVHRPNRCSIIYGALPPESRSKQAHQFNIRENNYKFLAASDAVGMGLNLNIKRIVFLATSKFDGKRVSQVSVSQIKQIAGRAGRFQIAPSSPNSKAEENPNGGSVTAMNPKDLEYIQECLETDTPVIRKTGLFPSDDLFRLYTMSFGARHTFDQIIESMEVTSDLHPSNFLCGVDQMSEISQVFRGIRGLSLNERITLAKAPVKTRSDLCLDAFKMFCTTIAQTRSMTLLDFQGDRFPQLLSVPEDYNFHETDIAHLESIHAVIILYLWLSYRFPMNFRDREGAMELKTLCEVKIDTALSKTRHARLAKWKRQVNKQAARSQRRWAKGTSSSQDKASASPKL